jgi:ribosomal protein S18 acetylase RimI-like enzyme
MSEPSYAVRRATAADAVELARLAASTFTETFGHLYPPDDLASFIQSYTPAACLEVLADRRLAYWLLGAEGQPAAGFALAGYCKLPVANLEPTAGELRQLYVRAPHQAKGLGTRLFETALAWLEQHYAPLYIGVWANNLGAQRFYGRYGFVKVGEYGFPVGRTVDREFILRR